MERCLLQVKNVRKSFAGVQALDGVSLSVREGECHAILGANGAGKSTLIKILAGVYTADEGSFFVDGKETDIGNVRKSRELGISVIHQELVLVPHMTIAENIFLGQEETASYIPFINRRGMNEKAQKLLDVFQLPVRAEDHIATLSVAQQQMVEICRAMSLDARLIIMDEPSASLTQKEVAQLFDFIARLKARNIAVLYVSHRLEELFAITDRISVFRDGRYIDTFVTKDVDRKILVNSMVGRTLTEFYQTERHESGSPILEVRNLNIPGVLRNINFDLRRGEILGFSGIVGAGRTELAQAIFGIRPYESGTILVEGKEVFIKKPQDAIEAGIGLVPESRKEHGLDLLESVAFNLSLQVLPRFIKGCFVDRKKEEEIVDSGIKNLQIRTSGPDQQVKQLSGGNQQKVVIAKWLARSPRILILDEPTRGIDVGAKAEIYHLMNHLVKQGISIIMISSELAEVLNMSDRILVMYQGRITGELSRDEATQEAIMEYATGAIHE